MSPSKVPASNAPSSIDTQWLVRMYKQFNRDSMPVDVVDVDVEDAVHEGDNYASQVARVKIKVITASGSRNKSSIIVKRTTSSEKIEEILKETSGFRYETQMYINVLRSMENMMYEFDDKRETLWPKLYGYTIYDLIALEDMTGKGFTLSDRTVWQNLDYALLVLRNLGRYHAMAKVLQGRGVITDDDKGHFLIGGPVGKRLFETSMHMLSRALINQKGHWNKGWEQLGKKIEKKISTIATTISAALNIYDKRFEVLNHGDLWAANMMFRIMEYTGVPVEVKFLDYQLPHLNSFIWDVTYYMYTSVVPSVRRANKYVLLEAYQQALSDNLKFFKWKGYIPTLDDVMSEAKRVSPAAFVFIAYHLPVTSATVKKPFALEKLMDGTPEEIYAESIFTEDKYVREIGEDLKDFSQLGVFD